MNQHYPTWAQHPLMKDYYDHYWGRPVYGESELFEWLCLEIFQAGARLATSLATSRSL